MDITEFLKNTLKGFPIHRLKIRAEIELQKLVDDRIIYHADCHFIRDANGTRNGVNCVWIVEPNDILNEFKIYVD